MYNVVHPKIFRSCNKNTYDLVHHLYGDVNFGYIYIIHHYHQENYIVIVLIDKNIII